MKKASFLIMVPLSLPGGPPPLSFFTTIAIVLHLLFCAILPIAGAMLDSLVVFSMTYCHFLRRAIIETVVRDTSIERLLILSSVVPPSFPINGAHLGDPNCACPLKHDQYQ